MNFLKQAQEFAAAANTNTDNQGAAAPASGGFGSFMSEAQNLMQSQGAPAQSAGAQSTLPGGRQPPTTGQLLQSTELLYGAATGQKATNQQLAGAAEDLLGGLAAHGNLDQGQYGTYINQAESFLQNYSGQGQPTATSAPTSAATSKPVQAAPAPAAPAPAAADNSAPAPVSNVTAGDTAAAAPASDPSAAAPTSTPSWMSDNAQ